jgi:hypothetical protein
LGRAGIVVQEQYRDFLKLRRFRQTRLVRAGLTVERPAKREAVRELSFSPFAALQPADVDLSPGVPVRFTTGCGAALTVDHPLAKAAFAALGRQFPRPVGFGELPTEAAGHAGQPTDEDRQTLEDSLLTGFAIGLLQAGVDPPPCAAAPGEKPRLSPLARHQLETGAARLTSLTHAPVNVDDPLTRHLLTLLDGTRDRPAVLARLAKWVAAQPGRAPTELQARAGLAGQLDAVLTQIAKMGLLAE